MSYLIFNFQLSSESLFLSGMCVYAFLPMQQFLRKNLLKQFSSFRSTLDSNTNALEKYKSTLVARTSSIKLICFTNYWVMLLYVHSRLFILHWNSIWRFFPLSLSLSKRVSTERKEECGQMNGIVSAKSKAIA